ncbi:GNAT family N-acetyltransferase [Halorientalis marina]|uniref:GNAT family N-acetyltransferase n=1 Tax=Halorientalis marina TaxID=2931976 RepID=UPI001FF4702F|nr:GNAT family N-acetyltransferase [Halorientalis marina]
MEYVVLGWPPDGPTLRLHYERFSYAGKFVMTNTGKAAVLTDDAESEGTGDDQGVAVETDEEGFATNVLGAVSFNEDRTDEGALWLRYVTVREDRRGEGFGARLCRFVTDRARERGYENVRIAVNNPFAYEALYKAGFGFTGDRTGLAELVLSVDAPRDTERYQAGLDAYRERDLEPNEGVAAFLAEREGSSPPEVVDDPAASLL